jgi:hypothetical protein
MALSWPSAIRLAVAATLLVAVGVALFTLPVEKVRVSPLLSLRIASFGIRCLPSAVSGLATSWCVRSWDAHLVICVA